MPKHLPVLRLLEALSARGLLRLPELDPAALPEEGWLLQGEFVEVEEGSRLQRAALGFGRGATHLEVQVRVSNLKSETPTAPFLAFGTFKSPKKVPGAVISMNPYVAAAKFVMEKHATEKDIQKSAEQIAEELLLSVQKFKEEAETRDRAPGEPGSSQGAPGEVKAKAGAPGEAEANEGSASGGH